MNDIDDYDDNDAVDEEESQAAEKGGDAESDISENDVSEAESLSVTSKQHIRDQLEDEVARFLAQGGKITQMPAGEDEL